MWSKYSCVDWSTEEKWSRQTTEQHQSMGGDTWGELSKEGWYREPCTPQRQQTTFSHCLHFILLSSDLAPLMQTLCTLHRRTQIYTCSAALQPQQQLVPTGRAAPARGSQRSTGGCPGTTALISMGQTVLRWALRCLLPGGAALETPWPRRPSHCHGQCDYPGNNTNVQTCLSTSTARASL